MATDEFVLTRVLALKVVARAQPTSLGDRDLHLIRVALFEERWAGPPLPHLRGPRLAE